MALFIEVEIDRAVAQDRQLAKQLVEACPVNIFAQGADGALGTVDQNLDECTLCELCLNVAPPGTVRVKKLYGARAVMARKA